MLKGYICCKAAIKGILSTSAENKPIPIATKLKLLFTELFNLSANKGKIFAASNAATLNKIAKKNKPL